MDPRLQGYLNAMLLLLSAILGTGVGLLFEGPGIGHLVIAAVVTLVGFISAHLVVDMRVPSE